MTLKQEIGNDLIFPIGNDVLFPMGTEVRVLNLGIRGHVTSYWRNRNHNSIQYEVEWLDKNDCIQARYFDATELCLED